MVFDASKPNSLNMPSVVGPGNTEVDSKNNFTGRLKRVASDPLLNAHPQPVSPSSKEGKRPRIESALIEKSNLVSTKESQSESKAVDAGATKFDQILKAAKPGELISSLSASQELLLH